MRITTLTLIIPLIIISYAPLSPDMSVLIWGSNSICGSQVNHHLESSNNSSLELFINGVHRNGGEMIQIRSDDVLNVTVFYRNLENGTHIPNATVILIGWSNLSENSHQSYNITIKGYDLEQGITILTIFAEKENYQPQSIQFFVELVEKESQLDLFVDSVNKTLDPFVETTIRNILNITMKYRDSQTGLHITNATIQLIGDGLTLNLTESSILEQYNLLLNTTNLSLGINFFAIIAQAPNYLINIMNLRIDIYKIIGTIYREDGGPHIEVLSGEDVLLKIILKDPQNNTIKDATVIYLWVYGQEELEDIDSDGIYEAILSNVQEGVYSISILAFAGDDYTFETYVITLIVNPPSELPPFTFLRRIPGYDIIILLGIIGLISIYLICRKLLTKSSQRKNIYNQ